MAGMDFNLLQAGTGMAAGVGQGILGVGAYLANKKYLKTMPMPDLTLPSSLFRANKLAEQQIQQGMPGYDIAKENIASQQGMTANRMADIGGSQAIGGIANASRGAYSAYNDLAIKSAQFRLQQGENLINQMNRSAGFEQQNKQLGYEAQLQKWDLGRMNTQNLFSSLSSALGTMAGSASSAAGNAAYNQQLNKMNPWNQQGQQNQNIPQSIPSNNQYIKQNVINDNMNNNQYASNNPSSNQWINLYMWEDAMGNWHPKNT